MGEMHLSASPAWDSWSEISTRLPANLNLDALARDTKAVQRRRGDGIGDGTTLFRLSLAHGPGGMSLQQAATWAHMEGVAEITAQSLHERLHGSVAFLSAVLQQLLAARTAAPPQLWKGHCLRIADGSSLSQPGSKGTDWRVHAVYDLGRGGFSHLGLTDGNGAESLLRCEPAANEILIADRGYAKARQLLACLDPAGPQQRDFIVRIGWKALVLSERSGKPFSLIQRMQAMATDAGPQEWAVEAAVGSTKRPQQLPLRLIVVPLPAEQAAAARLKLKHKASKRQSVLDPHSVLAAGFLVLVTSLPGDIHAAEVAAAYRLRWQIELAFKRLKSLLHLDRLPTRTTDGSMAWLLAHLILALLIDDTCQDLLDSSPCGACFRGTVVDLA